MVRIIVENQSLGLQIQKIKEDASSPFKKASPKLHSTTGREVQLLGRQRLVPTRGFPIVSLVDTQKFQQQLQESIIMETPVEWSPEIRESYDPIRVLGKGGFASVVLAREKFKPKQEHQTTNAKKRVAIKVVGCSNNRVDCSAAVAEAERAKAVRYAKREIEILQHLEHANIVELYHSWINHEATTAAGVRGTAAILVLEYSKGPTVESLLRHGGALSNHFGRLVIAQVMDALAYLHYRAVVHRDIKPDNIIVSGALSSDDFIWDNDENDSDNILYQNVDWSALRKKYKVTLIDFGFARALTPSDLSNPRPDANHDRGDLPSYHGINPATTSRDSSQKSGIRRIISTLDMSIHRLMDVSTKSNTSLDQSNSSARSATHRMKRTMSTLGNRNFAAPEIIQKVRPLTSRSKSKKGPSADITETISNFVADYGLLVDSYSMGHTIRYMMSGVQPGTPIEDAIQQQKHAQWLSMLCCKGKQHNASSRSVRYRKLEDLPGAVYQLIDDLTQVSSDKRLSIRKARRNTRWIREVLEDEFTPPSEEQMASLDQLSYLPFAIQKDEPQNLLHPNGRIPPRTVVVSVETDDDHLEVDESDPMKLLNASNKTTDTEKDDCDEADPMVIDPEVITF